MKLTPTFITVLRYSLISSKYCPLIIIYCKKKITSSNKFLINYSTLTFVRNMTDKSKISFKNESEHIKSNEEAADLKNAPGANCKKDKDDLISKSSEDREANERQAGQQAKRDDQNTSPQTNESSQFLEEKDKILNLDIAEKRKLYKCKDRFLTLEKIPAWPEYYHQYSYLIEKTRKKTDEKPRYEANSELNAKISLLRDDITKLEIDAIVNAANESLLGGGGVDGAIHSAAGCYLVKECATLKNCNTGEAKITGGYKLPAKYVIHTVGPRGKYADNLEQCYENSLNILKEMKLTSIAFPCISTGIFGYPNVKAANEALKTVRGWLEKEEYAQNIERIIFCIFLPKDEDIYHELLPVYFPLSPVGKKNSDADPDVISEDGSHDIKESKKEDPEVKNVISSEDRSHDIKESKKKEQDDESDKEKTQTACETEIY